MAAAEKRQRALRGSLVRLAEHAEPGERFQRALSRAELEGVEAAARQEMELVAEDVTHRTQLAAVAVALPQEPPERHATPVAEALEIDRDHAEVQQILDE